jgi:hypothetical protein
MNIRAAIVVLILSGCAVPSPMGGLLYCPQGHVCESAMAPAQPASAPRRVQWGRTL